MLILLFFFFVNHRSLPHTTRIVGSGNKQVATGPDQEARRILIKPQIALWPDLASAYTQEPIAAGRYHITDN